MLPATARQGLRAFDGHVRQARVSRSVFRAAYKELCARIWVELELLAQAARQVESRPPQDLVMRTVLLRLELVVLVDSCRTPQWRCMLPVEQRDRLCSMLTDLLAALYVDPQDLRTGIADAQDRVLDELLPESESGPRLADLASACELGPSSNCAAHELISLIEAQATDRACAEPVAESQFAG